MSEAVTDIDSVPKIAGEAKEKYEERLQKERKERKKKLAAKIAESGISFSKDPWEHLVPPWRSAKVSARCLFCRRIDKLIIICQWNTLLWWLAKLEKMHRKSKKITTPEINLERSADSAPPLEHSYYPFQICQEWAERNQGIVKVLKIKKSDPPGFDDDFFNFDNSDGDLIDQMEEDVDNAADE